jgi:hypothetical protein
MTGFQVMEKFTVRGFHDFIHSMTAVHDCFHDWIFICYRLRYLLPF